jgi:N-acylneuraminate cytidylyltransferase
VKALIPVRRGSQRVKNKNIRAFTNSSLLEIKIKQLQRIDEIEEVCVNSDCEVMLEIAGSLGATPILRDPYYATSNVPMNEVWRDVAESMDTDVIVYTNVTNPLIHDKTYSDICQLWNQLPEEYDSITTVHAVKEYLWYGGSAINYDPDNHPRSQELPRYLGLNFAISIIPKHLLVSRRSIIGKSFYPYIIDHIQAMDIDEEEDFELAEILYTRRNNIA